MSLILCPECGARISDRATKCPHCGFESRDTLRPISEQDKFEEVPFFEYDMGEWHPNDSLRIISYEDNKRILSFFGSWENMYVKMPAIAEVIGSLVNKDSVYAASMDEHIKKLIRTGRYRLIFDKNGYILPTIRDNKGRIVAQVRLKEVSLSPQLMESINNLTTQVMMEQILEEVKNIGEAIRELHIELQNDRLALVESSRDKLKQAQRIQDTQLRKVAIIGAINSATDAKRILMRNFTQNLYYIKTHSQKSIWQMAAKIGESSRDTGSKSIDSFQDLVFITHSVKTECEGYGMLGEYNACKECLNEFKTFIEDNELDQRDTLLLINENTSQDRIEIVNNFSLLVGRVSERIEILNNPERIEQQRMKMITN